MWMRGLFDRCLLMGYRRRNERIKDKFKVARE
jgi:hypothetical protein